MRKKRRDPYQALAEATRRELWLRRTGLLPPEDRGSYLPLPPEREEPPQLLVGRLLELKVDFAENVWWYGEEIEPNQDIAAAWGYASET